MMMMPGTYMQGVHTTQVNHHTQIDLLTCRVCFVNLIDVAFITS